MADKVTYAISCTPQEELTNENGGTQYVIASEVNKGLGGSGESVVADYAGTASNQGYLNATVNYLEAIDILSNLEIFHFFKYLHISEKEGLEKDNKSESSSMGNESGSGRKELGLGRKVSETGVVRAG